MAQVLLYNITDDAKRQKIGLAAWKLGIAARSVKPEEYSQPLGWLLGLEGFSPAEGEAELFSQEMLVMHGLSSQQFSGFLDALRRNRVPVALKAVATEHNVAWSSATLCRELQQEHEAMKDAGKSVHRSQK